MKENNIRELAHDILMEVEYNHGYSDELINQYKNLNLIDDIRDFNLLRRIVLGVLEYKISLDYIIKNYSKTKLNKMDPRIIMILRIAIFQMIYLDQIPDHASINDAVNHSKKIFKWISGFVNGLLRNISRNKRSIENLIQNNDDPSIKYNLPLEIVKYLSSSYGEAADKLMMSFYKRPKFSIRINQNKANPKDILKIFKDIGIDCELSKISSNNILIDNPEEVNNLDLYKNGTISIQGEGSSKAVDIMGIEQGVKVLDLCSAPGTKSMQIAERLGDNGLLVSNDINADKNEKIVQNFNRINFENYQMTNYDATILIPEFIGRFDYVLVDAPCSALGLISRKPEIRYRRSIKDIKDIRKIQRAILDNAIKYLKPGAKMVYSTCTYGHLENTDNFDYIISKDNIIPESFEFQDNYIANLQLYNDIHSTDGFYISKFRFSNK
ncbi:MAG: 16S rRNA (cytosine(967)-C(5))-methyltransferase RsmB [Tissierellia bacterium]|nr:16S rRNA (cytosine(967)-C(5))-methyltransferase RsmB [Tissierellia bacterium]